jgi:hypothetical protein
VNVVVAFPWRPQESRVPAFQWVSDWFAQQLPDAPQITTDTPHQPFNLAACRNKAVNEAAELGADVVVVCDADVVPDPKALQSAIAAAARGGVHMPFHRMVYLSESETAAWMNNTKVVPARRSGRANGGTYVVSPSTWRQVGGQDERFRGWGGEDDGFVNAATTLSTLTRHKGLGRALAHDSGHRLTDPHWRLNSALAKRYSAASSNPAAMRRLISEGQMNSTYLILCAGEGTRWQRPYPKHSAKLCGERLIDRVVRQVNELDPGQSVRIVVKDTTDDTYRVPGARRVKATFTPELGEIDKMVSASRFWSTTDRTVVLLGDVFYTESAMRRIIDHRSGVWAMFGRPGPSKVTGKTYNENFAVVFWPEHHSKVAGASERLADMYANGQAPKASHSQWFQVMLGSDPRKWVKPSSKHYVAIDDWTDDFDSVDDWERWCWRYAEAKRNGAEVPT